MGELKIGSGSSATRKSAPKLENTPQRITMGVQGASSVLFSPG
jgi:hypothetical protein